jgi:membrane fusion protein, multidrug efflux system
MSEEGSFDPKPHRPTPRGLKMTMFIALSFFVVLALVGIVPRLVADAREKSEKADNDAQPAHVAVAQAAKAAGVSKVTLPGSIQPVQETIVYARTNGYVKRYTVDIGDKVKTGQVLAELETPDIDQELRQARAQAEQAVAMVAQARSQADLASVTANRYTKLQPQGVVSQQELEERQTGMQAQQATLNASMAAQGSAEANVRRLEELKTFATVRAPFDGKITTRNVETGQLVVAGTSNGQPMFTVDRTDVVRVFINIPQIYSPAVVVGSQAPTMVHEYGARQFPGVITRTASALDDASRTLLTEVRIPNDQGTLLAGMYAQVEVDVQSAGDALIVPATSLLTTSSGMKVAVVQGNTLHWHNVIIEQDLGDRIAVRSDLSEGDQVITMPSFSLNEGAMVIIDDGKKS